MVKISLLKVLYPLPLFEKAFASSKGEDHFRKGEDHSPLVN